MSWLFLLLPIHIATPRIPLKSFASANVWLPDLHHCACFARHCAWHQHGTVQHRVQGCKDKAIACRPG
eukprot:3842710-Amphidinium_carterae.1